MVSRDETTWARYALPTLRFLRGQVGMLFITHQLPKGLQMDEVVNMGQHAMSMHVVRQPHDLSE